MSFITNHPTKDLAARLADLIESSKELKFLVGFFYFSGWRELYEPLKRAAEENPDLKIKILVGMSVDRHAGGLLEVARQSKGTRSDISKAFAEEFARALSDTRVDLPEFPEQARFFLQLLEDGRLELRKTREPNHAKLYLFKVDAPQRKLLGSPGKFITGSSNLTHAGLRGQHEFNVEIGDYGFEEAEAYFDELWRRAVPLRPEDVARLREIIERGSLAAEPTPFEVYALLIKRYLELLDRTDGHANPEGIIKHAGYQPFPYQIDAAKAALAILEAYGGVILADVVGLGKSVVASLIGRMLGKRGVVISPPGLIGERGTSATYGWRKYLDDFGLFDWELYSSGKLEPALFYVQNPKNGIEVVVVDEAHRFRNPDTYNYALLRAIAANKKVVLLTATPYNNTPMDIFALISLFDIPGASKLAPTGDLFAHFKRLTAKFHNFSYILRFYSSPDKVRKKKAQRLFKQHFGEPPGSADLVRQQARDGLAEVAREVKRFIAPVTLRRNRLDLKLDPRYRESAPPFPEIQAPQPIFYALSDEQSEFYDRVIRDWFGPEGSFRGAIYQPEFYKESRAVVEEVEDGSASVFALESQRNLANFMRRLLVRRFESSFGAFAQTLGRLEEAHRKTLDVVRATNLFVLDRKELESLSGETPLDIEAYFDELAAADEEAIQRGERKRSRFYDLSQWSSKDRERFIADLEVDLELLKAIQSEIERLGIAEPANDPKARRLVEFLEDQLKQEPKRKIVVFSEFTDTVNHVVTALRLANIRVLKVSGAPDDALMRQVLRNFDASLRSEDWSYDFDVLFASDTLSEGVNLARAGAVVNYDIPWNPTRVIQRVGRINRIGTKVFDELYLFHFFPTEQGQAVTNPKAVAEQKLFLIHQALGEDARILNADEEPQPSRVYQRLTENPEENEEVSFDVKVRLLWEEILMENPDIEKRIQHLPNRVKVARPGELRTLIFLRKARGFYAAKIDPTKSPGDDEWIKYLSFPEAFPFAEATPDTPRLEPSDSFWSNYSKALERLTNTWIEPLPSNSLERRALFNLNTLLHQYQEILSEGEAQLVMRLINDLNGPRRLPRYAIWELQATDLGAGKLNEKIINDVVNAATRVATRYKALLNKASRFELPEVVVGIEFRAADGTLSDRGLPSAD